MVINGDGETELSQHRPTTVSSGTQMQVTPAPGDGRRFESGIRRDYRYSYLGHPRMLQLVGITVV